MEHMKLFDVSCKLDDKYRGSLTCELLSATCQRIPCDIHAGMEVF